MNYELFTLINNMSLQNHTLDQIMIAISQYVPIIMSAYLILLITWSFIYKDRSLLKNAISVISLLGITLGVNYGLEHLIYMPRPFVEHTVHLVIPHSATSSFPSTHAMATMAIALGVHHYYKRIGSVFIALSILTGLSRIYLGHHYPFDVIGGFAITYLLYILFNTYIKRLLINILSHTKP